jgi:hypothetical protein
MNMNIKMIFQIMHGSGFMEKIASSQSSLLLMTEKSGKLLHLVTLGAGTLTAFGANVRHNAPSLSLVKTTRDTAGIMRP